MGGIATMVAPFTRRVLLGTISTGYARRAEVHVDIEWDGSRLSLQGDAKRPGAGDIDQGGQMQDAIREAVDAGALSFAPLVRSEGVRRLLEVWDRWHLNDMRAGCEHQRADGWAEMAREEITLYYWRTTSEARRVIRDAEKAAAAALKRGETVTLAPEVLELAALPAEVTTATDVAPAGPYEANGPQYGGDRFNRAREVKTRGWVRPSEHPLGLLTAPCPSCWYEYGSAWLREEVPVEVLEELKRLPLLDRG